MDKNLSVIIPTFNETENIEELIKQIYSYNHDNLKEIIVVDDNSPDGTWKIVKKLQKKFKTLKLIRRMKKKGLPGAIWTGIVKSRGEYILWMDSDLSHPPKLIQTLIKYVPEYDIVCASRYIGGGKDNRNFKRVFASRFFSILSNLLLRMNVKDVTSGFYIVKRGVFYKVRLSTTGYAEYCIRFIYDAKKNGFKIKEVGYTYVTRKKGTSKTDNNLKQFIYKGYLCMNEILRLSFKR